MKLARDKGFERLVKLEKGKNSGRSHQIKVPHQESKKMSVDLVNQLKEHAAWEVSSTDGKTIYQVLQLNKVCPYTCSIISEDCEISLHMYSCNCPDALIRATICKHIHLVVHFLNIGSTTSISNQHSKKDEQILQRLKKTYTGNVIQCRDDLQTALMALSGYITHVTDINTFQQVKRTLATNLIKTKQQSLVMTLLSVQQHPPNNNIVPQQSFYLTKRKRKGGNVRMEKSNTQEKMNISTILLNGPLHKERVKVTQTIYCKC